jgi:hypothetical protein
MQRSHCYNSSPTSVVIYNRDRHNDNLKSIANNDDFTLERTMLSSLHNCSSYQKDICFVNKCFDEKPASLSTNKDRQTMGKEKMKLDSIMVCKSQPPQTVYESSLQAFMQQLLAEQNCSSTESFPVVEDSFSTVSMLSLRRQQLQLGDSDSIPELQESYTSSSLTGTENGDTYYDYRYDSISTLGDNDDSHTKYYDLPSLIDISREMRSFM